MNSKVGTTWPLEPHTEAKHEILRYYLGAWFPIIATIKPSWFPTLGTTKRRLLYVDGFAGPGEYEGGKDGSPIIALKVAKDHKLRDRLQRSDVELVFYFIEKNEARFQNLELKLAGLQLPANFRIEKECRSFEDAFGSALSEIEEQSKRLAPSFVFIDPFGPTGFPMSLVERLARQPSSEVLITFNYQALNQWFLNDPSKYERLDELYGGSVWRQAIRISVPSQKESYLMEAYREELESLGWKVRPFRMINKHNQTQYYLFFATSNPLGMLAMKRAMWSAAPTGDFKYSDLTNPQQPRLFDKELYDEEYSQDLANQLYQGNKGHIVCKKDLLKTGVAWHPICIERHLTRALKILEYESTPPKVTILDLPNGRKRHKGQYPADCTITFVLE